MKDGEEKDEKIKQQNEKIFALNKKLEKRPKGASDSEEEEVDSEGESSGSRAKSESTFWFPLMARISLTTLAVFEASRPVITTVAPIPARACAVLFPIPFVPPVMRQIFPCMVFVIIVFLSYFRFWQNRDPSGQSHSG